MSDKSVGLIEKYRVERVDGKPVGWCFVLQDTDPITPYALLAYAREAKRQGFDALHADLLEKAAEIQVAHVIGEGS